MKIALSWREVRVIEGLRYRESTVTCLTCQTTIYATMPSMIYLYCTGKLQLGPDVPEGSSV